MLFKDGVNPSLRICSGFFTQNNTILPTQTRITIVESGRKTGFFRPNNLDLIFVVQSPLKYILYQYKDA